MHSHREEHFSVVPLLISVRKQEIQETAVVNNATNWIQNSRKDDDESFFNRHRVNNTFPEFWLLPFRSHFSVSSFHLVWSFSVTEQVEFSLESGKKSLFSKARSLPVLTTSFIHWKRRRDIMLTCCSWLSLAEIFLYPLLSMTHKLKRQQKMASRMPGVSNRTKSNRKPIELNRMIGVRLRSVIEHLSNFCVSSIIEQIKLIEQNRTQWNRLCSIDKIFLWVRLPSTNTIERSVFDCRTFD